MGLAISHGFKWFHRSWADKICPGCLAPGEKSGLTTLNQVPRSADNISQDCQESAEFIVTLRLQILKSRWLASQRQLIYFENRAIPDALAAHSTWDAHAAGKHVQALGVTQFMSV